MSTTETPDLLFFDTFSHDTSEELNLDLVQFPKSVYVREIRIIPLGARVEGDFAGGVRLGATNPTKFHIDFFVNDLSKPGASTFEALGSLEYCQNGQIHMECSTDLDHPRIPTDGLVLKGWYTTITLAVYGNLTQVIPETPIGVNPPPPTPRPAVIREPPPVQQPVAQNPEWTPEPANPIPAYTGNVAVVQPDVYGPNNYPENYENPYRAEYYETDAPKDPRTYLHVDETEWEKRDISCEREGDRLRRSSRSVELERERERRDGRSRRRSIDRRSRESSRLRDRSRDERLDRPHSRSRSRDRDYIVKGEYRPVSRSRSRSLDRPRSLDRLRTSADRDWDRASYKKDDYRRHRDASYDRSRAGSYDKDAASYGRRSPYEKRAPSYERKGPYEKRGSSYEKQSPYERKRHSPYGRIRGSSYSSRSPSRDEPRKRPRTPPADVARRPLSPHADLASPAGSPRSEEPEGYDRSGKQIPRVDFYHQSYRHKSSIRSPSEEGERPPYPEPPHSSLVTVQLVDTPPAKAAESPVRPDEDKSMDAEQFEPILSDEDICDDLEGSSYMEGEYELNEYCGVDDIIKYYNPFKTEWTRYQHVNKIHLLNDVEGTKDVRSASFEELCEASPDLFKLSEIAKANDLSEQKVSPGTFLDVENSVREDWVHQCEQVFVSLTNLCKHTDIILRVFPEKGREGARDEFAEVYELLITFCRIGLTFELALAQQQPTYKIRHMKCGIRLAEALTSHAHNERVTKVLLEAGIDLPMSLLEIYSEEYMALSIRLMILKALNACLSSKLAVDKFMKEQMFPKFDKNEKERKPQNGYRALVSILQTNPLTRIKFALSALIKKLNLYELLAKLHELVLELDSSGGDELPERDVDFIVNALDELLHTLRSRSFHISQPKRFLPVSAQFDIGKEECSNEGLLRLFSVHRTLPALLYLVTSPATCSALPVVSPVHELLHELVHSESGLEFLYRNMETGELLFRALMQAEGQPADEAAFPHDLTGYTDLQLLALEMAYRLRALHHLRSIADLQAGALDENDLIDRLQALYCLGFGGIGRTAVPDVVVMGDNAECLMEVFEADLRAKKTEPPAKRKSPAKGYAVELIAAAVRHSADVPFLKRYARRLAAAARDHERFEPSVAGVLQELGPYLRPAERPAVLAGEELAELAETVRAAAEHAADLPGDLTTALRVLLHLCVPARERHVTVADEPAGDEYAELRYKYNALQLYSLDGAAALAAVLERLAAHFEQPGMHTAFLASARGLQLAQLLLPCLRLLDELLARAVRSRGPRFRDLTAAPVLLRAYGLARAFPAGCVARRAAARAAQAAVRALLAYAQPIADDAHDGASIRRGPWTSLCSEVISYTMTAPYTFVPGLLAFSELLPLPLPMRTRARPTARELADAADERRLWSAHLHALAADLTDMIQIVCTSTYRPVVHVLRRVCVQVADLAPNTAGTVARAALGAVLRELRPGEPASASAARVLGFLACLVSHAPVKCAALHALSAADLQAALCGVLAVSHASNEHAAAQEFAAHALAAFCDIDVTLTPAAGELLVSNSLPSKEALAAFLEATAACLESPTKTCAVAQSILRAYFVLTCHEYGFQQFRKFVAKKREALGKFFRWSLEGTGEERAECLSLYIDLIRILRGEEGEGTPGGRRSLLTSQDMADMVGFSPGDDDHPVLKLDAIMKERNSEEDAAAATLLSSQLAGPLSPRGGADSPEPPAPPAPLPAQFLARTLHAPAPALDDRLTTSFWLNVPVLNDDDEHDTDLVPCDLVELANSEVMSGGAALCAAVRRLAGCLDVRAETRTHDDKRPAVALSRVRADGAVDAFRSRPPNTSRPPSLHVDDFTALHRVYSHNNNRGMRRGAAGGERGRFGAQPMPAHYRHLRGRGAWEMGGSHFGHFAPSSQYMMGGMGWGGGRMQRGPRHRSFMR